MRSGATTTLGARAIQLIHTILSRATNVVTVILIDLLLWQAVPVAINGKYYLSFKMGTRLGSAWMLTVFIIIQFCHYGRF